MAVELRGSSWMTGVQFLAGSMNARFANEIGPALQSVAPQPNGHCVFSPFGAKGWDVSVAIHLCLVLRLRTGGAKPPVPYIASYQANTGIVLPTFSDTSMVAVAWSSVNTFYSILVHIHAPPPPRVVSVRQMVFETRFFTSTCFQLIHIWLNVWYVNFLRWIP